MQKIDQLSSQNSKNDFTENSPRRSNNRDSSSSSVFSSPEHNSKKTDSKNPEQCIFLFFPQFNQVYIDISNLIPPPNPLPSKIQHIEEPMNKFLKMTAALQLAYLLINFIKKS